MKPNENNLKNYKDIPILQVASKLGIKVNRANKSKCFIHEDQNPSLQFYEDSNTWYCFGCTAHGDNINLIQEFLQIGFKEALSWFDSHFNIQASLVYPPSKKRKFITKKKRVLKKEKDIFSYDPEVYEWLINSSSLSKKAKDYLIGKRGLQERTLIEFNIKDIDNPHKKMEEANRIWGKDRLVKCGLLKQDNMQIRPVWWNHVILFPFYDMEERIIYIQGRQIGSNSKAKYLNLKGVKPRYLIKIF